MTTWTLHPDADGEPTLWDGGTAVLREATDLARAGVPHEYRALIWRVLTAVLAPSDEVQRRIAQACGDPSSFVARHWADGDAYIEQLSHWYMRAVLAALAAPPQDAVAHTAAAMARLEGVHDHVGEEVAEHG